MKCLSIYLIELNLSNRTSWLGKSEGIFLLFLLTEVGHSSFNMTKPDRMIQPKNADDGRAMFVAHMRSCSSSSKDGNGKCTLDN